MVYRERQKGGKKRGRGDNDAYMGGAGDGEGGVFQHEVQADPGESRQSEVLFFSGAAGYGGGSGQTEQDDSNNKPDEQDFRGVKAGHEILGGNVGNAPDRGGEQGCQMSRQGICAHAAFLLCRIRRRQRTEQGIKIRAKVRSTGGIRLPRLRPAPETEVTTFSWA